MKILAERETYLPSLAFVGFVALGAGAPAVDRPRALEDPADDAARLERAYRTARRSVRPVDGGHRADHPGQRWRTFFDGRGFLVLPDAGGWTWGLELVSWGFAGSERSVCGRAATTAESDRLTYAWEGALEEWYVNGEAGLEHGYTVHGRPLRASDGARPLTFTLAVRGDVWPIVDVDGRGVRFLDAGGAVALTYAGLRVFDADGRELEAGLEPFDGGLLLSIDERAAEYPLTIDPLAQRFYVKASNTGSHDHFGYALAAAGDTMIVGADSEDSAATGVNGDQGDGSGGSGAAYVFFYSGTSWSQQAYLKASNTDVEDEFGTRVAISGDTVVVGALQEDSAATGVNGNQDDNSSSESGAAYVFVRDGTTWTQQAYLKASNTGMNDLFGISVAISGDTIVVGAYGEDSSATGVNGSNNNNAPGSGAAYVFVRDGTTWSQQAYLKASNTGENDRFGSSVAISEDTIVVGARTEDSSTSGVGGDENNNGSEDSGAAYVFVRSGTTWSQQAYLKASNTGQSDEFGCSVAIDGDTIVIGARGERSSAIGVDGDQGDDTEENSGAAYVFVRSGTFWTQQAYLKASNTGADDQFGFSTWISGDSIIIGAIGEDSSAAGTEGDESDDDAQNAGAAYVFLRGGTTWAQQAYLKATNTEAGDVFGYSVAEAAPWLFVGAPQEDSEATGINGAQDGFLESQSGAVYVFDRDLLVLGSRYCDPAVSNSSGSPGAVSVVGSPVVADDDLILRATSLPLAPGTLFNVGYFVMGTGANVFTPPGSAGPLCVAPGLRRYLPPPENTEELAGGFERIVGTSGPVSSAITAGSTWNFQAWHRDIAAGTSNLTDAVSVVFQ